MWKLNRRPTSLGVWVLAAAILLLLWKFPLIKPLDSQQPTTTNQASVTSEDYQTVDDNGMRAIIEHLTPSAEKEIQPVTIPLAITSHHIPTAASFIGHLYTYLADQGQSPRAFVVIGPDHYERCPSHVTVAKRGFATSFGTVEVDKEIQAALKKAFSPEQNDCLATEHTIATQAPFIAHLFPQSKLVGVTFSGAATPEDITALAQELDKFAGQIIIVESTDFSHYLSVDEANQIDAQSLAMIRSLDASSLSLKHIDSPATLRLVISLAKSWHLQPIILDHKNLYDLTGQSDNTTGYINAVFTATSPVETTH